MMTRKQKELFDFISGYMETSGGIAPSFDEMAEGIDLASKSGIFRILNGLEERGFISRLPKRWRAIEILRKAA